MIQVTVLSQTLSFMVHRDSGPNEQQLEHCLYLKSCLNSEG